MLDGMTYGGSTAQAERQFAEAVREIFGNRCKAAWLSGSYVYDGARPGRSDIDIVLVMEESVPAPADAGTLARIRAFVDAYLGVHAHRGLDPDLEFPGEYVAPASIAEAIAWRGLAQDGAVADQFPCSPSSDYWPGRPDRWFHAWLSMTAFTRFLTGDRGYHEVSKLAAWKAILRYLLLRSDGKKTLTREDLWRGLAQFGVKPRYEQFWAIEGEWLGRALAELEAEGVVEGDRNRILPVAVPLRAWERQLETQIAADEDRPPLLLPPKLHREIGAYAAQRWEAMTAQAAI